MCSAGDSTVATAWINLPKVWPHFVAVCIYSFEFRMQNEGAKCRVSRCSVTLHVVSIGERDRNGSKRKDVSRGCFGGRSHAAGFGGKQDC